MFKCYISQQKNKNILHSMFVCWRTFILCDTNCCWKCLNATFLNKKWINTLFSVCFACFWKGYFIFCDKNCYWKWLNATFLNKKPYLNVFYFKLFIPCRLPAFITLIEYPSISVFLPIICISLSMAFSSHSKPAKSLKNHFHKLVSEEAKSRAGRRGSRG